MTDHLHFEVGEVAIFVALCRSNAAYDGQDVVVESALGAHCEEYIGVGYWVSMEGGHRCFTTPDGLRKKPKPEPPKEAIGDWDECPWRPEMEIA